MTDYFCDLCGQKFTTPTGSTSARHLKGKRHKAAIKIQPKPSLKHEILLYNALSKLKDKTYSNILTFFSSFGVKTEITLKTIIKKLKDKDIGYEGDIDKDYKEVLQTILISLSLTYPLTFSISEAEKKFKHLGYKHIPDLINFFNKLSLKYPEFIFLSSSKLGKPSDLITFKQIFVDNLTFYSQNRWDL